MIVQPLQLMLRTAFSDQTLAPGFSANEIAAAQARLEVPLPEALRDYLAVCGGSSAMMDVNYRLFPPECLRMGDGHLIFGAEVQGPAEYGVPVEGLEMLDEDPHPGVQARKKGSSTWFLEAGSVSAFLLGVGSFQAVLSLNQHARFKLPSTRLEEVMSFFEPVGEPEARTGSRIAGFIDCQHLIVGTYLRNPEMFWVGSSAQGVLENFAARSGFELEWVRPQVSKPPAQAAGRRGRASSPGRGRPRRRNPSGSGRLIAPLQLIVQTAFPAKALAPGSPAAEIAAAEACLAVTLPEALKDYLAVCGGSREMMDANYRLFSPDRLRIEEDHLIFGTENQGTMEYGVPVQELDRLDEEPHPTVDAKAKNGTQWLSESGSISSFLLGIGSFQAVQSVDEQARFELPVKRLKDILKFFEPLGEREVQSGSDIVGFVDRKHSIVGTYLRDPETFWVGSSVDGALKGFAKRSGFELDWV